MENEQKSFSTSTSFHLTLPISKKILDKVFALACTDDGTTGRALSLVSPTIHDISFSHKYFSIHTTSVDRLINFAAFLEQYHAPVQYLMLDCTIPGLEQGPIHAYHYNKKVSEADSTHSASIDTIFRVLAPCLQGLYFIPGPAPVYLDSTTFPHLQSFYVYGDLYQTHVNWDAATFPSLTRLHVSCNSRTHLGHGTILARIEIPTLTHLGCCAHRNSMGILVVLAALNATRQPPGWQDVLDNIKRLETMRVQVQSSPIGLLPELCEYTHTDELLEALEKTYPAIWGVPHNPVEDGIVPVEEWTHVVSGGVGFLKASKPIRCDDGESC